MFLFLMEHLCSWMREALILKHFGERNIFCATIYSIQEITQTQNSADMNELCLCLSLLPSLQNSCLTWLVAHENLLTRKSHGFLCSLCFHSISVKFVQFKSSLALKDEKISSHKVQRTSFLSTKRVSSPWELHPALSQTKLASNLRNKKLRENFARLSWRIDSINFNQFSV